MILILFSYYFLVEIIQDAKRNLDQIGGGHLVRDTDKQLKHLLDEADDRSILEFVNGKEILDQEGTLTASRDRNSFDSSNSFKTVAHPANYLYGLNGERANDELLSERNVLKIRDGDRRYTKNLDQIGGGHLVRNLDQIGGGHLVRNLDQIGGGHLVRNLDQIGGGHLVRNLDQIGGGHLVRNLDQIGGGHLVRNLDQIGGGNLLRSVSYSNGGTKQHIGQSTLARLHPARNLDQIGGGNLVRNLDHIGGGNLVRNLDQIGGGNLVWSLKWFRGSRSRWRQDKKENAQHNAIILNANSFLIQFLYLALYILHISHILCTSYVRDRNWSIVFNKCWDLGCAVLL